MVLIKSSWWIKAGDELRKPAFMGVLGPRQNEQNLDSDVVRPPEMNSYVLE